MIFQRDLSLHEGIRLLLQRRYVTEAAVLLLSQFESTLYLLFIGQHASQAELWRRSPSKKDAPGPPVRLRIRALFASQQPVLEHYLALYETLSMIKHANPLIAEERLFGSARPPLPRAPRTEPEKNRQEAFRVFDYLPQRDNAHWFLGESCELLVLSFERLVDWYGADIRALKGGLSALRRWRSAHRQWATIRKAVNQKQLTWGYTPTVAKGAAAVQPPWNSPIQWSGIAAVSAEGRPDVSSWLAAERPSR